MSVGRRAVILGGTVMLINYTAVADQVEDNHGPFGLIYGSSSDIVRQNGVSLEPWSAKSDWGKTFVASGLSKVLSDMEPPVLSFGFKDSLWRVAAAGKTVESDPYGNRVVARYQELAVSLSQRYGYGMETDTRDHEMWKEPNEYVMSIKQGRASRYTEFKTPGIYVELSIRAVDNNSAFYLIIFKSKAGAREFENDKEQNEKSAL
ncbi:MAG: hypothetical protein ACRYGC_01195 [Janthinobacterium lividum]